MEADPISSLCTCAGFIVFSSCKLQLTKPFRLNIIPCCKIIKFLSALWVIYEDNIDTFYIKVCMPLHPDAYKHRPTCLSDTLISLSLLGTFSQGQSLMAHKICLSSHPLPDLLISYFFHCGNFYLGYWRRLIFCLC